MRINHVQEDLINRLYNTVKDRFPNISLKDISVSPDDPEHIWVNVIADMDVENELMLREYSAELEADIDTKYGYRISIMPECYEEVFS